MKDIEGNDLIEGDIVYTPTRSGKHLHLQKAVIIYIHKTQEICELRMIKSGQKVVRINTQLLKI